MPQPLNVLNYGQTIGQAQNIVNAKSRNALLQQELGPNSMNALDRQYRQAQIDDLNNPAVGGDPTSNMRDILFLRKMEEEGRPEAELELMRDAISKRWYGNIAGVPGAAQGGVFDPMSNIEDEAAADYYTKYRAEQGKLQAQKGLVVNPPQVTFDQGLGGGNLPQPSPVSTADVKAAEETAVGEAKAEVERKSPKEIKKQSMREGDAVNAMTLIDDMLAPRKDDPKKIYATYAYGRANEIISPLAKPQEWIDAEAKRNQLVSMMQLENVAKLKGTGPITEPEQKVLRQAMTVLENNLISPELVERELKRVRIMFAKWKREARAMQGKDDSKDEGVETYEQRRARILGQ